MINDDRAVVKRAAAKAIAAAASAELSGLGVLRRGNSPRYWFNDRGWWRINVWFEPSGFSVKIRPCLAGQRALWRPLFHGVGVLKQRAQRADRPKPEPNDAGSGSGLRRIGSTSTQGGQDADRVDCAPTHRNKVGLLTDGACHKWVACS